MSENKCYCFDGVHFSDVKKVKCFHKEVKDCINDCYDDLKESDEKIKIFENPMDYGIPGWDPVKERRKTVERLYRSVERMEDIFALPFVSENDYQEVVDLVNEFITRLDGIKKEVEDELYADKDQ